MPDTKPVNVLQLALDAGLRFERVMKQLSDWKRSYFIDGIILLQCIVKWKLTRKQVLEWARRFQCDDHSWLSNQIFGETRVKRCLYSLWRAWFLKDLEKETSPDKIGEMIAETNTEDDVRSLAIQKWISLKKRDFETASSLEELSAVIKLPIGVYGESDPAIASVLNRWKEVSSAVLQTIGTLETLVVFEQQCHWDLREDAERLHSELFQQRISKCTCLKQVIALRDFATDDWTRHLLQRYATDFAIEILKRANTREKVVRMARRRIYRALISHQILLKLTNMYASVE